MCNFQDLVQKDLVRLHCNMKFSGLCNLSLREQKAIHELRHNKDIIVRKAEKGGSVVLMDMDLYIKLNKAMLEDPTTYTKLKSNPTKQFLVDFIQILCNGVSLGVFNDKLEYLLVEDPVVPVFHALPKTHKNKFPPQ